MVEFYLVLFIGYSSFFYKETNYKSKWVVSQIKQNVAVVFIYVYGCNNPT